MGYHASKGKPVLRAAGTQGNGIVVCSEGHVHFDSKMWENADYDGENDLKSENPSYIFLGFYPSFHISLENS